MLKADLVEHWSDIYKALVNSVVFGGPGSDSRTAWLWVHPWTPEGFLKGRLRPPGRPWPHWCNLLRAHLFEQRWSLKKFKLLSSKLLCFLHIHHPRFYSLGRFPVWSASRGPPPADRSSTWVFVLKTQFLINLCVAEPLVNDCSDRIKGNIRNV